MTTLPVRLRALADLATPEQSVTASDWYQTAADRIHRVASNAHGGHVPRVRAVYAAAALSPQQTWEQSLACLARLARGERPRHLRHCEEAARRAWVDGIRPSGRKVGPFADALLGDRSAIVVDTHMLRACGLSADTSGDRVSRVRFEACALAIREASEAYPGGWSPRDFQALVWVVQRGAAW